MIQVVCKLQSTSHLEFRGSRKSSFQAHWMLMTLLPNAMSDVQQSDKNL
jgi:hypothetical protein